MMYVSSDEIATLIIDEIQYVDDVEFASCTVILEMMSRFNSFLNFLEFP